MMYTPFDLRFETYKISKFGKKRDIGVPSRKYKQVQLYFGKMNNATTKKLHSQHVRESQCFKRPTLFFGKRGRGCISKQNAFNFTNHHDVIIQGAHRGMQPGYSLKKSVIIMVKLCLQYWVKNTTYLQQSQTNSFI